jgi:hypothetical protein
VSSYRRFKGNRYVNLSFIGLPDPEDEGTIIIRNVLNLSPHNITLYTSHLSFSDLKSRLKKLVLESQIGLFEIGTKRQILISVEIIVA